MEIWIRSQNKKFFGKIDNVYYQVGQYDKYEIRSNKGNYSIVLGIYNSDKTALKIIDKIQDLLFSEINLIHYIVTSSPEEDVKRIKEYQNNVLYLKSEDDIQYLELTRTLYEMPEKDEDI